MIDLLSTTSGIAPASRLARAVQETYYIPNPSAREFNDDIHPFLTAVDFALPVDDQEAIRLFIERIELLDESDYGDFMRDANLYLHDLAASLETQTFILKTLGKMQDYTQFSPDWRISPTKRRLLKDARTLKQRLDRFAHS